jgi:hypothetical protein
MTNPTNFYYTHRDRTLRPLDKRRHFTKPIVLEQFYFVGYRIEVDFETHYQHALLIADDYEALINGHEELLKMIVREYVATPPFEISLVYLRSLKMLDPCLLKSLAENGIQQEVEALLVKRDDDRYAAIGLVSDQLELYPLKATDALAALRVARLNFVKHFAKYFMPLSVSQAHPVTKEFDRHFNVVSQRVTTLMSCNASCMRQVH